MQNRQPADRLADVRSEIKRLEAEEEGLRAYLSSTPLTEPGRNTSPSSAHNPASGLT